MFPTATYTHIEHNKYKNHNATNAELNSLVGEPTKSKGGHFAKLKWFSIAKLYPYREALKLRGAMAPLALHLWLIYITVKHHAS